MEKFASLFLITFSFSLLFSAPGDLVWRSQTGYSISGRTLAYDRFVYVQSKDLNIYCYNAANGMLKWCNKTGDPAYFCTGSDKIFCGYMAGCPCYVVAYNAITGGAIWGTDHLVMIPDLCYADNVVYAAGSSGSNNRIIAFQADNGAIIWEISTSTAGNYAPAIAFQKLYVYSNGALTCYNPSDGSTYWEFICGRIMTYPSPTKDNVFFGSNDSYIYCLNNSNGSLKWSFKTNGGVISTPSIWETMGMLYVGSRDSTLYSLDTVNGHLNWVFKTSHKNIDSGPFVKDGYVYFGCSDYYIYALNAYNGQLAWKYRTDNFIASSPWVDNGIAYIGSGDSYLYAIETYGYTGFKNNKSASKLPDKDFEVSPNPFSSHLSVSLDSTASVYSLTGQLIRNLPKGKHSIDTSSWIKGVYIVKAGKHIKKVLKI